MRITRHRSLILNYLRLFSVRYIPYLIQRFLRFEIDVCFVIVVIRKPGVLIVSVDIFLKSHFLTVILSLLMNFRKTKEVMWT